MNKAPIRVTLISKPTAQPLCLAAHGGNMCYQPEVPPLGTDDSAVAEFVRDKLAKVGHHTTLQSQAYVFDIDGIAISDVTFGLHLASPFYNSDQRSGRFCGAMFNNPDYDWIRKYISFFWPETDPGAIESVIGFVRCGIGMYQSNITEATDLARDYLKRERPHISDKALAANAPKIAQEQLRMLIPTILPTALVFTVDLTALVSLWLSASSPAMRYTTEQMRAQVVGGNPELAMLFDESKRREASSPWSLAGFKQYAICQTRDNPSCELLWLDCKGFVCPPAELLHPFDLLHFTPEMMNNRVLGLKTKVTLSVATMGQDQRHRTVNRGVPAITRFFFLAPLIKALAETPPAEEWYARWYHDLRMTLPDSLHTAIVPYGAMVQYEKTASLCAAIHEQGKRTCFCAQPEIYELSRQLAKQIGIEAKSNDDAKKLLAYLLPNCLTAGTCGEGSRYCGRDLRNLDEKSGLPYRVI